MFDACRIGWGEALHALGTVAKANASRMELSLPGSGRILFRSMDNPDNARGHTADMVVMDEAAYCRPESWSEVLRPMLMDTGGTSWRIGSPNGRNWLWQDFVRAADDPNTMVWQAPTKGYKLVDGKLVRAPHQLENPAIGEEEIEQLLRSMLEVTFQQEILAEFTEHEGQVFRFINENLCAVSPTQLELCKAKGHRLCMGIDWGMKRDYTAISVGCAECARELHVEHFNSMEYPAQRNRIMARFRLGEPEVLAEANAMGLPNIQQLREDGIPVQAFDTTMASKAQMIQRMRLAFEQRSFKWLDVPWATHELEAYEMKVTPLGHVTYGAPEGLHDDGVIARALMLTRAQTGSFSLG